MLFIPELLRFVKPAKGGYEPSKNKTSAEQTRGLRINGKSAVLDDCRDMYDSLPSGLDRAVGGRHAKPTLTIV
jgi:hypothetical protein